MLRLRETRSLWSPAWPWTLRTDPGRVEHQGVGEQRGGAARPGSSHRGDEAVPSWPVCGLGGSRSYRCCCLLPSRSPFLRSFWGSGSRNNSLQGPGHSRQAAPGGWTCPGQPRGRDTNVASSTLTSGVLQGLAQGPRDPVIGVLASRLTQGSLAFPTQPAPRGQGSEVLRGRLSSPRSESRLGLLAGCHWMPSRSAAPAGALNLPVSLSPCGRVTRRTP